MSRKQLIILVTLIILLIAAAVIGFAIGGKKNNQAVKTPEGKVTIDPVSGESVTKNTSLFQQTNSSDTPDRPIILGINKLADYGLSVDQQNKVYNALYSFSINQSPKIKAISFYKDSYKFEPQDDQGMTHITFKMQANEKDDYYVSVAYGNVDDAVTSIYKPDQTTLLFTQ